MAVTEDVTVRPAHGTDEQARTSETRDREADGRDRIADERDRMAEDRGAAANDRVDAGLDRLGAALDRGNARVERTVLQHDGLTGTLQRAFGIAERQPGGSIDSLLRRADADLYDIRRKGRAR